MASELWQGEVILTLLDEVRAVHIRLTPMNVWGPRLENPFSGFFGISLSNGGLGIQDRFADPL